MYRNFIKRFSGFVFALIALVILSPVMLIMFIAGILIYNGKPFFVQNRVGYKERIFRLFKFKTMRDDTTPGKVLSDDERLNSYGKFLRRTSLDELPQLILLLTGEMTLIGPRPLLIKYLPWYTKAERKRHSVRPGITGLAQVEGRNSLNWDDRLKLDRKYVDELSLTLDLSIFFRTMSGVISAKGLHINPREKMFDLDIERKNKRHYKLNERFLLRKPRIEDADQLIEIKNNSESSQLLVKSKTDYNKESIQKWIQYHNEKSINDLFIIEDLNEKKIIGHAALYDIDPISKSCEYGILIGNSQYWGMGIGKAITAELIDIAFHELMLQFIFLKVLKSNIRAVRLYESLRFEIIDEETLNDSTERDDIVISMQLEHDD